MNRKIYVFIHIILACSFLFYCSCKRSVRKGIVTAYKGHKCFLYEVRRGDSLWKISQKFNVSFNTLKEINKNVDPKTLQIGQSILVPVSQQTKATVSTSKKPVKKAAGKTISKKKTYTKKYQKPAKKVTYQKKPPSKNKPVFHKSKSSRRFSWPAQGAVVTRYGAKVGVRSSDGIDISLPYKTKLTAADDGKVVFSGTMEGYGNIIIIDHLDSYFTLYAYNAMNAVQKDSVVKKGQTIAYSGNNLQTNTPALHFQIRFHGKSVDPLKHL